MHPFTPPARIPALPTPTTPKKEKKTSYFTIPLTSDAPLTEGALQQLARSSIESQHPIFSRSSSKEPRAASRGSSGYDKLYGRSGSIPSIPTYTANSSGLTGLGLMQAAYTSTPTLHHPQPYHKVSQYLTGAHLHLPPDSCAVSDNSGSPNSDFRGREGGCELRGSTDMPSAPAPTSNPTGAEQHLDGADLQLPPDKIPALIGHRIGADIEPSDAEHHLSGVDLQSPPDDMPASVGDLIGADSKLPVGDGPTVQWPHVLPPHAIDHLEKAASVEALLLERSDPHPYSPVYVHILPVDDSLAPPPPPLPIRRESVEITYEAFEIMTKRTISYENPVPPGVVTLISTLDSQGDSSSDRNWPLPDRTPVYTFLPPPPSASPIASSLDASIPSNIPSPVGSPVTAFQQQYVQSFIPPPHALTPVVAELSAMQEPAPYTMSPPPRTLSSVISEPSVSSQPTAYSMIPPPYNTATSSAPYNQSVSSTPNSMAASSKDYKPAVSPTPTSLDSHNRPSAMPGSMATHYRESSEVAAAREAYDEPSNSIQTVAGPANEDYTAEESYSALSQESRARLQMPGRFPTGDSIRSIDQKPSTSQYELGASSVPTSIAPYSQPAVNRSPYNVAHEHADSDAVAAARAAYLHPAFSKTSLTAPYDQGYQPDTSLIETTTAQHSEPSTMPSSMASHYRESSAVDAAKDAYDEPAASIPNSISPPNQPAAMPSSMASHYRESIAVAAVKAAYDQPVGSMRTPFSPANQPAAMPSHMASRYRESSAVAKARVAYDEPHNQAQPASGALSGAIAGFNNAFNRQSPAPRPVEMSASVRKTAVQSPIPRVSVPIRGSTPDQLMKPLPVAMVDAALAKQPPFRHTSRLNHSSNSHPNAMMNAQPLPGQVQQYQAQAPTVYQGQRPPIDRQLPAVAPSLYIETVQSFPHGPGKEPSFWRRRRKILAIILVFVLIGIGVGIVFVAQSFYKQWGGVGFLGTNVPTYNDGQWRGRRDLAGVEHEGRKDGRKSEKGLLEGMLMSGYKRGWGADFKHAEAESSPLGPVKEVKHVQVIPVGSDASLLTPFAPEFEIGSTWWNARVSDMQKRGEEIINEHSTPEDALMQAAVLAQRFVDEIRARIEGNGLQCTEPGGKGPSCSPCCSDVEIAKVLASDSVNRVPSDVANDHDLDLLLASMDTEDMKRPAQEVAILAAQRYTQRVPEDVSGLVESQSRRRSKRDTLPEKDTEKLNTQQDGVESGTVTVTKTRLTTGAPTGLTPQDRAKQYASGYAEAVPHEDDIAAGSPPARRDSASKAEPDAMPWSALRAASPSENATLFRRLPNGIPKEPAELMAAAFLGASKHGDAEVSKGSSAVSPSLGPPLFKRLPNGIPKEPAELMAAAFLGALKHDNVETAQGPAAITPSLGPPLSRRLPNGIPSEPAELMAASFQGARSHSDKGSMAAEMAKRNAGHYARQIPDRQPKLKRSWTPYEVAKQMAGEYAKAVPDHKAILKRLPNGIPREPAEVMAATLFEPLKRDKKGSMEAEEVKRTAGHYVGQASNHQPEAKRSWTPYEVAKQMAGEYAKAVPDRSPLSKRLPNGIPREPAEVMAAAFLGGLKSEETAGRWADVETEELERELVRRKNVPFVTCGDHQKGCEAHGHPEICCPVLHTCHKSATTNSGIICCPGNEDCSTSSSEASSEAFCPPNTVVCPAEAAGGCCPTLSQCSPNGCLEFAPGLSPSNNPAKATTETRELPFTTTIAWRWKDGDEAAGVTEILAAVTKTITVAEQVGGKISVTATVAKDGEVPTGTTSLSPEETYASGAVVKPKPGKSGGERRWSRGGRMGVRLGGVAVVLWML